jgi:aryl-alcohol dehydrogenase-like predicted oxidoreductase
MGMDKPVINRVNEFARERELPPSQVALAWLLHKPAVTSPIAGAPKPHHLEDAVAALSVKLSEEEIGRLEELYQPHPATEAFA